MKKLRRQILGIGLLELMLSLSIIAILIALVSRYFAVTSSAQKTNEATEIVTNIVSAEERWLVTHNDYTGITLAALQARNYFPSSVTVNPWGGNITVSGTKGVLSISLDGIPKEHCLSLAQKLLSATCSTNTTYTATDFCGAETSTSYTAAIKQPNTCLDKKSS